MQISDAELQRLIIDGLIRERDELNGVIECLRTFPPDRTNVNVHLSFIQRVEARLKSLRLLAAGTGQENDHEA